VNQLETTRAARNFVDISPINVISLICFYTFTVGNGNADISTDEHFENEKISRGSYLYLDLVIFVFYRDPVPLNKYKSERKLPET
jgi:hypothetical protein